jgi:hypothetical protein
VGRPFGGRWFDDVTVPRQMIEVPCQSRSPERNSREGDDWILLSSRQPTATRHKFDRANQVIIDRQINHHAAFALGTQQASTAASAPTWPAWNSAFQAWLERIPDFSLDDPSAVSWSTGQVRGPRKLPLRIRSGQPSAPLVWWPFVVN